MFPFALPLLEREGTKPFFLGFSAFSRIGKLCSFRHVSRELVGLGDRSLMNADAECLQFFRSDPLIKTKGSAQCEDFVRPFSLAAYRMRFFLLVLGGVSTTVLLLWLSWTTFDRYISNPAATRPGVNVSFQDDAYAQALRIAQTATFAGKTANSSQEWFAIAGQWQQAAELLTIVPKTDRRYKAAQTRLKLYRSNTAYARRKGEASR